LAPFAGVIVDETERFDISSYIDNRLLDFLEENLLPVGRCHVDAGARRIYAMDFNEKAKRKNYLNAMTVLTVD